MPRVDLNITEKPSQKEANVFSVKNASRTDTTTPPMKNVFECPRKRIVAALRTHLLEEAGAFIRERTIRCPSEEDDSTYTCQILYKLNEWE